MLYVSSSEDATGEGRAQLIDSNWIVCSQNVEPGAMVMVQATSMSSSSW